MELNREKILEVSKKLRLNGDISIEDIQLLLEEFMKEKGVDLKYYSQMLSLITNPFFFHLLEHILIYFEVKYKITLISIRDTEKIVTIY